MNLDSKLPDTVRRDFCCYSAASTAVLAALATRRRQSDLHAFAKMLPR